MPIYAYECPENGQVVEVRHKMDQRIRNWGELCFAAQIQLGDTPFEAPVRKRLMPPAIAIPTGNATLKNAGFTKLVKRDEGVYENVTATGGESRYMRAGDQGTLPHLHKKIGD
ncbi:MAG: zinc ribbon domain-containing protein [Gammaproteobacteria bacterium]